MLEEYKKRKLEEFKKKLCTENTNIMEFISDLIGEVEETIGGKEPNANVSEYYSGSNARKARFEERLNNPKE
jgi:hypothetical protein